MKRIVLLTLLISVVFIIGITSTVFAEITEYESDLIVGTWVTTKIIEGESVRITYEFHDSTVSFKVVGQDGKIIVDDNSIPDYRFHYIMKRDLLIVSLVRESGETVEVEKFKIVYVDLITLMVVDVPISKSNTEVINSGGFNDKIVVFHRKGLDM